MNPRPSSVRCFSKYAQSMMSRASSVTPCSSRAGNIRHWSHALETSGQRVKFSLAATLIKWVAAAAEIEPERHRAELQVAADGVHEVAAIALRQFVSAVAEHDKGRRAGLHL